MCIETDSQEPVFKIAVRGTNSDEYQIYLRNASNGSGMDITTGLPLKTFAEWLES